MIRREELVTSDLIFSRAVYLLKQMTQEVLPLNWMSLSVAGFIKEPRSCSIKNMFQKKKQENEAKSECKDEGDIVMACHLCKKRKIPMKEWDEHLDWHMAVDLLNEQRVDPVSKKQRYK